MDKFINAVDSVVMLKVGVSVHDMPDFPFYDYFDDRVKVGTEAWKDMVMVCVKDFLYDVESEYGYLNLFS